MDGVTRTQHLADLARRLGAAVGAAELIAVTGCPEGLGITRTLQQDQLRVGPHLLPSPIPRVVLDLDPPIDARTLCQAWAIARPVAVADDVHQTRWGILVRGEDLPDPHVRRIAARPLSAGRWDVHLWLTGRPPGDLPDMVAGASPAYDVLERGGHVRRVEVSPLARPSAIVGSGHPDARALLDVMSARYPAWRPGWEVLPDAEFVVVYEGERPVAGAAIGDDGEGSPIASRLCVSPDRATGDAGSALLDVLEAVALDRGSDRLRLDGSVFLLTSEVPYARHGYIVAPPYDGDADGSVWAERDLRWGPG